MCSNRGYGEAEFPSRCQAAKTTKAVFERLWRILPFLLSRRGITKRGVFAPILCSLMERKCDTLYKEIHCIDNGPSEDLWGIIKSEMYCIYKITDETSLRSAIDGYMKFHAEERPQERFHCKTPLEVRSEALSAENPAQYPIAKNKRIEIYKAKWCA